MAESKFLMALDQGTTSSRAIIFNHEAEIVAVAQKEFQQFYPMSGWVEHDAKELWTSQASVATEAIAKANISANQIASIGITNQRETTIVWDKKTGEPVHKAIVWQDRRTANFCNQLKAEGKEGMIAEKTGLIIDAYFSATKLKWILDNVQGARERAERGELCFGTVDSWLIYKLTSGKEHITDVTNASRTMLFNIHSGEWDEELLQLFDIPSAMLPEVKSSSEVYCTTSGDILSHKIPISGIAGDQQAALFGQMCIRKGMAKTTYGTGCFLVMNTGTEAVKSQNKLLTTIAWKLDGQTHYALEGSVFIGGAAIQWLRDGLELFRDASETEALATAIDDNEGIYFVPALTGLGAPHWDQDARGTFFGLSRGTNRKHMIRAALEAIAYQVHDVLRAMEKDSGGETVEMRADGGASVNNFLMQFQADLLDCEIKRPVITETTALGAAFFAGLAVGYWDSIDQIEKLWQEEKSYQPIRKREEVEEYLTYWNRAIERSKSWLTEEK